MPYLEYQSVLTHPCIHLINPLLSFKAWRRQDRLGYIQQLESRAPLSKLAQPGSQLPPNVQPSQLQVTEGGNIACSLGCADILSLAACRQLLQATSPHAQCHMLLLSMLEW